MAEAAAAVEGAARLERERSYQSMVGLQAHAATEGERLWDREELPRRWADEPEEEAEEEEEPDPLEARRDAWWESFSAAAPDDQLRLFGEALRESDLIDCPLTMDVLEVSASSAPSERHRALVDELRLVRPHLYEDCVDFVIPWLVEDALQRKDPAALARAAAELARAGVSNPDMLESMLERLAFYGHGRLLLATVEASCRAAEDGDEIANGDSLGNFAARLMLLDVWEREPNRIDAIDEAALLSRLGPLAERVDRAGLAALREHLAGRRPPIEAAGAAQTDRQDLLAALGEQFVIHLRREEAVPTCLGALATRELMREIRHVDEPRAASRHKPRKGKRAAYSWLVPTPRALEDTTDEYAYCAAVELLPAWLRFLEARGFLAHADCDRALTKLRGPAHGALDVCVGSGCVALKLALKDWPRPAPAGGRAPDREEWKIEAAPAVPADARPIDWTKALEGVPSADFFEGIDLDEPGGVSEALRNFLYALDEEKFLTWEAIIRREQHLGMTQRQRRALEELIFSSRTPGKRIRTIDGSERPNQPWYEILRRLAPHLAAPLPFRTDEGYFDDIGEGWSRIVEALKKGARGLSLPQGVATPLEVVPPDLRHRLSLQTCFEALHGLGQRGIAPLSDPEEQYRVPMFVDLLRDHRDSVEAVGMTLRTLPQWVSLPKADEELLLRRLSESLRLDSPDAPIAAAL